MKCRHCEKIIYFDKKWVHRVWYHFKGKRNFYTTSFCYLGPNTTFKIAEPKEKPETFNELYEKLNNE